MMAYPPRVIDLLHNPELLPILSQQPTPGHHSLLL